MTWLAQIWEKKILERMEHPMDITRTDEQIDEQINAASEQNEEGTTRWPGMTYEQGVDNALRWVTGQSDDVPMED